MKRFSFALALGIMLHSGLFAEANSSQADRGTTVTMRVPFMIDNTDAIMARDRLLAPPTGIFTVPNMFQRGSLSPRAPSPRLPGADLIDSLFRGNTYFPGPWENGLTPGDPDLAVGPTHTVSVINGLIQFHTKAGTQKFSAEPHSFFTGIGSFGLIFDPRAWYDPYAGRFWILYGAFDANVNRSWVVIALSDDNNPEGTWAKWAINVSLDGSTDHGNWLDYPGFGGNNDVVIVTGNMFPFSSGSVYGKIRMMPKAQFLSGSPTITYTDYTGLDGGVMSGQYSQQPARHIGTNSMPLIANVGGGCNIFGIQNPLTTHTLVMKTAAMQGGYSSAAGADQPGTTAKLDTLDARIYDVCCRNNRLVMSHNIGGGAGSQIRWYEVNVTNMPTSVSLAQQGTISHATSDCYYTSPLINGAGNIGMAFTRSSSTEYASLYYTGQPSGYPAGVTMSHTLKKASTLSYGTAGNTERWGDYMGAAVDPNDDTTFWAIGMLPTSSGYWVTEVYSYIVSGSPPTETVYPATSITSIIGSGTGGGVSSLYTDDDLTYNHFSGVTATAFFGEIVINSYGADFYAEFDVGVSPKVGGSIDIRALATLSCRLDVKIYNFSSGKWDNLAINSTLPTTETAFTYNMVGDVAQYVSSSNKVRVRIQTTKGFSHTVRTDLFQVRMSHF